MTRKKKTSRSVSVDNYTHSGSKRKNIPTAKIAAEGRIPKVGKVRYAYSPHITPELQFEADGQSDRLAEIVSKTCAGQELTTQEQNILRSVGSVAEQPWLEWAGKKEEHDQHWLEVEPVALHIHERVSANAIIRAAMREDVERDLFADPQQAYQEAVQFYQHDVDWANRLILGDSQEVMSSLSRREDLAGKVQMIYIDPPYGVKFASNFQPLLANRNVKDRESDLTREPEMVRAYRDTWHLGVHSYLSYLRDRFLVARDLLSESGSIFVQISDENLHRVRQVLDEVFGPENFCTMIVVSKTSSSTSTLAATTCDYLLWYSKDRTRVKYRQIFTLKDPKDPDSGAKEYKYFILPSGEKLSVSNATEEEMEIGERYRPSATTSQSSSEATIQPVTVEGREFRPGSGGWKTNSRGFDRLIKSERIVTRDKSISYLRKLEDFPVVPINDLWTDCRWGFDAKDKRYVVETNPAVISRCVLMTTDPGDLVLDPTCGSGTTALVSERWGRRWISIDSSRVAISLARQRLLTAKFDRYQINGEGKGIDDEYIQGFDPSRNFIYQTVPHITLASIARNENLDSIFSKFDPQLNEKLVALNSALKIVTSAEKGLLVANLADRLQNQGFRAIRESHIRKWLLPGTIPKQISEAFSGKPRIKANHIAKYCSLIPKNEKFEHWNVPFNSDSSWPEELQTALSDYRRVWREKMDAVNACIAENSEQESLVDSPHILKNVLRVSGPFTVEGVRPEELVANENYEIVNPNSNEKKPEGASIEAAQNASAYLDRMIQLLRKDGITFPNNEFRAFDRLEPLFNNDSNIHAEAIWQQNNDDTQEDVCNIAVAFGPQHGPVTAEQVEDLIRGSRRYDELVIAGFSFDGAAQTVIQESVNPRLKVHMAHIRPDVSPGMDGLLKDTSSSQIFSVFGQPEIELRSVGENEFEAELLGVDIYDPVSGQIRSEGGSKVAAWFLDQDYDGRCFCITQAFFPNQKAWDKIAKAIGSEAEALEQYDGTISLTFEAGQHKRIAVKVIDPRGNEVMAIRSLEGVA